MLEHYSRQSLLKIDFPSTLLSPSGLQTGCEKCNSRSTRKIYGNNKGAQGAGDLETRPSSNSLVKHGGRIDFRGIMWVTSGLTLLNVPQSNIHNSETSCQERFKKSHRLDTSFFRIGTEYTTVALLVNDLCRTQRFIVAQTRARHRSLS